MGFNKSYFEKIKDAGISGIYSLFDGMAKIFESLAGFFYMARNPEFYERGYFSGGLEQDRKRLQADREIIREPIRKAFERGFDGIEYLNQVKREYEGDLSRENFLNNKDLTKKLSKQDFDLN